ncbi:MAG: type II toxin-antitoxin system VapC family toxin [Candidatus Rokuibacteriota bacterium]
MLLTDAGPLVALLDRSDPHHAACRRVVDTLTDDLATAWPALTEAAHLLSFSWPCQRALLEMVSAGVLRLLSLDERDVTRLEQLMAKYRDVPMDLPDAALVRLAERERLDRVFTIDRRDFSIYRVIRRGRFRIIP